MLAAQIASTRAADTSALRGSILTTHWRCVPNIIAYSNDLIYKRIKPLMPMRSPVEHEGLPMMGYAHVRGNSERSGSSRTSDAEARIIAQFLVNQRERLLAPYQADALAKVVAIVTPFSAQAYLIRQRLGEALRARGLEREPDLVVGTVSSLQGAEARIVLYSHVVSPSDRSSYVDAKPNLLNVAVSRAQDHFLFFGDLASISNRPISTPTGLLYNHLVRDQANRLMDVPTSFYGTHADVQRITELAGHQAFLQEALESAREEILS